MTDRRTSRSRIAGFTLLEVIVAFVILALAFGAAFQTFSIGLRNANLAGNYATAVVHAESKLGLLGVEEPLQAGVTQGRFDRIYGWQQSVAPAVPAEAADSARVPPLYEVTLKVFWGSRSGTRELTLHTLRMKSGTGAGS